VAERQTEHWYEKAADAIIREGKTLFAYSNEVDLGLTSRECENVLKTKKFQETLRVRRNIYHKEIAADTSFTRSAAKGQLMVAITKLMENGLYDKAANAIMQLAKLEGWTSDGTSINVFNELTQADLVKLRDKFKPVGANPVN
jgi:hypothetical protein